MPSAIERPHTPIASARAGSVHASVQANDPEMIRKTNAVRERLESLSKETSLNESTLLTIMRTQELVKEIYNDASNS
mgnify:CR=1 FL=1